MRWLLSAAAWVHLVVLTRLAVRLPCFLWGFGCFCGPGVRRRVVAVLLESTRADWRALDVVAASPSSSQNVRKDEPLIARGGAGELGAEKDAHLVAVVALRWKSCFWFLCKVPALQNSHKPNLIHGRAEVFTFPVRP